jgi:nitrogen fixation NifU-like protein
MNTATNELQEIYRQRVLDHSKQPHNFHRPEKTTHKAIGFNPLCGDKISVYLQLDGERITDAAFEGTGCAISIASASMMTDAIRGQTTAEIQDVITAAHSIFTQGASQGLAALDEVEALAGVSQYPSRIKCAALAWSTAEAALSGKTSQISTEK